MISRSSNLSVYEGRDICGISKQLKRLLYYNLLTSGKLNSYLADIDEQAEEMFSRLVKQLSEKEGVNEKLKADDMMKWVGLINNIIACAEEVVMNDLIYA